MITPAPFSFLAAPRTSDQPSPLLRSLCGLLAAALLLATAGCSMMRLGYGQLDTIAVHMADDYFDLEPGQRQEFLKRFERLHEWHRRKQLPEYAAFLGEARRRLDGGVERSDVEWLMSGVAERFRVIAQRGAGDAAALLATVTPGQLEHLQLRWNRDNEKFSREHRLDGAIKERREASARRMVDQVEAWTGSLTDAQVREVHALSARPPFSEQLRHRDRMRRQREFLALMQLRGDREVFAAELSRWFVDWEGGRSRDEAARLHEAHEKRVDIYLAVARTLTAKQRAYLLARVEGFISDFTHLAER